MGRSVVALATLLFASLGSADRSGVQVLLGGLDRPPHDLSFSRDGRTVFTNSGQFAKLWDVRSRKQLVTWFVPGEYLHGFGIDPEHQYATGGDDALRLFTRDSSLSIDSRAGIGVREIEYFPVSKQLAVLYDRSVTFLSYPTLEITARHSINVHSPFELRISPDETTFALTGRYIYVYNASDGRLLAKLVGEYRGFTDIAYYGSNHIVGTGYDGSVRMFQVSTGEQVAEVFFSERMTALTVSSSGLVYAAGYEQPIYVLDSRLKVLREFGDPFALRISAMAVSDDETRLVTTGSNADLLIWDVTAGNALFDLAPNHGRVTSISATAQGTFGACSANGRLNVFDLVSGKVVKTFTGQGDIYWGLALMTNDGTRVISKNYASQIQCLRVATGELLWGFSAYVSQPKAVLSPDGTKMALYGRFGELFVIDVDTGQVLKNLSSSAEVTELFWARGGTRLLASYSGRYWRLFNGATFTGISKVDLTRYSYQILGVPEDSSHVFGTSSDGRVNVFDLETGTRVDTWFRTPGAVGRLILTPDGEYFIVGRADGALEVWATRTRALVKVIREEVYYSGSVAQAVTKDGRGLIVGRADGSVIRFSLDASARP